MSTTKRCIGRRRATSKAGGGETVLTTHVGAKGTSHGRVKFGAVSVLAPKPTTTELRSNVDFSTEALRRAKDSLTQPGVRIREKRDVPLFHVDEGNPGRFVRKLNGKIERGVLENGVFKVIA